MTGIPGYPLISVDITADGACHLSVAGRHVFFPAGDLAATRVSVTAYAVGMAVELGRPVRMTAVDPAGTWHLAAHPDGTISDLAGARPR